HQPNQQDIAAAKLKAQQLAQDAIKGSPLYQENQRLKHEIIQSRGWAIIFGTPIPQTVPPNKYADDNQANRAVILEWVEGETEPITDVRKWWTGIFKQNSGLAGEPYGPLTWTMPRPRAEIQ